MMTPELPRAPMSEPRLIAWHTSSIDSAVAELGAHRLERERHVRAGVAVGHRVDVEPVQLLLVGAQRRRGSAARAWRRSAAARLVSVGIGPDDYAGVLASPGSTTSPGRPPRLRDPFS